MYFKLIQLIHSLVIKNTITSQGRKLYGQGLITKEYIHTCSYKFIFNFKPALYCSILVIQLFKILHNFLSQYYSSIITAHSYF